MFIFIIFTWSISYKKENKKCAVFLKVAEFFLISYMGLCRPGNPADREHAPRGHGPDLCEGTLQGSVIQNTHWLHLGK